MLWSHLNEFKELWFPSPRLRLPELQPSGPVLIEGGRSISGLLGEYVRLWIFAAGRWHFYYVNATPRDFFLAVMPEAVSHLLKPDELTVETLRQGRSYKVILGFRASEGPLRVLHLVGDVSDVSECVAREEQVPGGMLGWKQSLSHIIGYGGLHGLIRLEDGRLIPVSRDSGEEVFKSSWVTFSR